MDSKEPLPTPGEPCPAPPPYAGPDTADRLETAVRRGMLHTDGPRREIPNDPLHPNYVAPWLPEGPGRLEIARPSDGPL